MDKNPLKIGHFFIACFAALPFAVNANAGIEPFSTKAAYEILREIDSPDKPALAIAVLHEGKLVYQKAFGSTNLDYKVAATVDTKFQVDALAWEFIAFAALMLEDQKKISLDDDIRKYLPEIPDLGEKITINHLLSSTDGLHGYKVLNALAGWRPGTFEQHKNILQLVKNQRKLNFKPGAEFSPGGDTRLILLASIVEVVSGQPFDVYCKNNIFVPLGMSNTVFVYDDAPPPDNTAVPYRDDGKGAYKYYAGNVKAPGPTNLYSSIKDLSTWRANISTPAVWGKSLTNKLGSPIRLDGGKIIKDISSISIYGQQHAGKERGISKIYQMGNSGGYASSVFHFPDQAVTAIVLSSGLAYNGSYGMRVAATLLKNHFTEAETIDYDKIVGVKIGAEQLGKYAGNYWSPTWALAAKVEVRDGILYYTRVGGVSSRELIPLGDSLFQLKIDGDDKYTIKFVDNGGAKDMHFMMTESDPVVFESYKAVAYTEKDLAQFAGTFHSEALDSSFVFKISKGILSANNVRTGTVNFTPIEADLFSGNKSFLGGVKFNRGANNEITGFDVVVDQVRHLEFKKIGADGGLKRRL